MTRKVVAERSVSIKLAWAAFGISRGCYWYEPKKKTQDEQIAQWLVGLTDNQRSWGFGLCCLYLRNVKGFVWNHKRVHRIYRQLELILWIRPEKRRERETPEPLTVPSQPN